MNNTMPRQLEPHKIGGPQKMELDKQREELYSSLNKSRTIKHWKQWNMYDSVCGVGWWAYHYHWGNNLNVPLVQKPFSYHHILLV